MIIDIEFVEEVDRKPPVDSYYGEYTQGTEWTNDKIYRLVSANGEDQYIAIGTVYGSYGTALRVLEPKLVKPTAQTINVWA